MLRCRLFGRRPSWSASSSVCQPRAMSPCRRRRVPVASMRLRGARLASSIPMLSTRVEDGGRARPPRGAPAPRRRSLEAAAARRPRRRPGSLLALARPPHVPGSRLRQCVRRRPGTRSDRRGAPLAAPAAPGASRPRRPLTRQRRRDTGRRPVPIDFQDLVWGLDMQDIANTVAVLRGAADGQRLIDAFRQGYTTLRSWPDMPPALLESLVVARLLNQINLTLHLHDAAGLADYLP